MAIAGTPSPSSELVGMLHAHGISKEVQNAVSLALGGLMHPPAGVAGGDCSGSDQQQVPAGKKTTTKKTAGRTTENTAARGLPRGRERARPS